MDRTSELLIRLELEALNAEFAYRVDHGPTETVADLFTPNGSYGRISGARSVGRDAIRWTYEQRRAHGERTARHIFTNLRLVYESDNRVRGTSIMTLYARDGAPPHPAQVLTVSDFEDVYVLEAGRWYYESRTIRSLFVGDGPVVLPLAAAGSEG